MIGLIILTVIISSILSRKLKYYSNKLSKVVQPLILKPRAATFFDKNRIFSAATITFTIVMVLCVFFFFLNITLFLIIFSEGEGTIDNQSRTSHTYTMITNQSKFKFATIYKDLDATKAE